MRGVVACAALCLLQNEFIERINEIQINLCVVLRDGGVMCDLSLVTKTRESVTRTPHNNAQFYCKYHKQPIMYTPLFTQKKLHTHAHILLQKLEEILHFEHTVFGQVGAVHSIFDLDREKNVTTTVCCQWKHSDTTNRAPTSSPTLCLLQLFCSYCLALLAMNDTLSEPNLLRSVSGLRTRATWGS